jgi:hypothetical protein
VVLRHDDRGVLAVGQAAHALLCGQLARAWGNARFGPVVPRDDVALGAEQHDVGMAAWDLRPDRNPATGLPYGFTEMPLELSVALWTAGPSRLITQSRYAALLAARHGRRLYERRDRATLDAPEAERVTAFLEHSRTLERTLTTQLRGDPRTAPHTTDAALARNSDLVWTWDTLSLALLLDWAPVTVAGVPTAAGHRVELALSPFRTILPWPFAAPEVTVGCEGRRLDGPVGSDDALADALAAAPWETIGFTLRPGE